MKKLAFDVIGLTGVALVSVGAGLNWGLGVGLMVAGGCMVALAIAAGARAARS